MTWRMQLNDKGVVTHYRDSDTGQTISAAEYSRLMQMENGMADDGGGAAVITSPATGSQIGSQAMVAPPPAVPYPTQPSAPIQAGPSSNPMQQAAPVQPFSFANPLVQPGAQMLGANGSSSDMLNNGAAPMAPSMNPSMSPSIAPSVAASTGAGSPLQNQTTGMSPTAGMPVQGKNLRMEGVPKQQQQQTVPSHYHTHGFLDATSIAILLPTLVLLALIIAAAHKKRLFPWQTIRTFNPPSGLMTPRDYERSYLCPPNLRRHGRLGKRNPSAAWTESDGVVIPFGFLARTHLPITIPMGRLPNKNMFLVAPSGSGKTTLMRAIIKALLAKPCVIIALEAKANDPNLDEKREGFKYSLLPEAQHAGFNTLYFNPLDNESVHWNPLELDAISFASSIVQDINSLDAEEQHWAERDHGYIAGLAQLLKWGAIQVAGEDENGQPAQLIALPCNPRGLMRLVNNRRNIVESLRRLKTNPEVDPGELSELTQTLTSIIRTDSDWDKNIQGVRGRLRMFKNPNVLRVTERSNVDLKASMHTPTVLIFGAPASLGPDAESLASCFVYQLQQALHTRYGTKNILPLFAFFDEYQTLNIDIAGRLSAIVRGANGGLTVILQNISQIAGGGGKSGASESGPTAGSGEVKTIFSNASVRVCLHNADETTARFFSEEIGKHAVVVPGISDHYMANGFGIFPTSWNRIHSQQVVARVDTDSIKRMEKHHALVYLSPAGDPEYGEVKPLMVDLRGIEEIARLHLLHNVSARRGDEADPNNPGFDHGSGGPGDVPGGPGGLPGMPGGMQPAMPGGMQPAMPGGMQPGMPGMPGLQPGGQFAHAGQMAPGTFDPFGAPSPNTGAPPFAQVQPSGMVAQQPFAQAQGYGQNMYSTSPQQDYGFNYPGDAQTGNPNQAPYAAGPITGTTGPVTDPNAQTRICPLCSKIAGKGKFCIECGQFIGAAGSATTPGAQVELSTSAMLASNSTQSAPPFPSYAGTNMQTNAMQVADAQNAYAQQNYSQPGYGQAGQFPQDQQAGYAPSFAQVQPAQAQPPAQVAAPITQRQPVTSFNLDPSKLGFAQPLGQAKSGQSRANVEF